MRRRLTMPSVLLVVTLFAGCAGAATPTPTAMVTPTPTPLQSPTPTPAAGASLGGLTITGTSDSDSAPFDLPAGAYTVRWSAISCPGANFSALLAKPSTPDEDSQIVAMGIGAVAKMTGDYPLAGVAAGRYLVHTSGECESWTVTFVPASPPAP